jgi:NADH-dependent peroxiredoxin subunit F
MYDLIIIGGGPAGASAAIYAARKQLKTLQITAEWGGQSNVSTEIQNWIGTPKIAGADLADALKKHVEEYKGSFLEVISPAMASSMQLFDDRVEVVVTDQITNMQSGAPSTTAEGGTTYSGKTLLIAAGAQRRKLDVPGAAEFDNKGLTYCASCDGPLFAGMDVAVIGGGNAAFETALQLLAYCKTVTLLNRSETFRADEISVAAAKSKPNFKLITNAVPSAVVGEKFVTGIKYKDPAGNETTLPVSGIFVEIGLLPNTGWVGDKLAMNEVKQIKVDPRTQRTSHHRVWAAGDITDGLYHQNNIAAGDAVKALEDVYMFIHKGAEIPGA